MVKPDSRAIPTIALVAAMFLWASSFVALKIAFRYYDPMVVLLGRMVVASLCMLPYLKKARPKEYRKGDWKLIGFLVFCEPCLYFVFEALALVRTSAGQAGMITAMLPLMVAVVAGVVLKEKIRPRTWSGFVVAIIGACWLSISGEATEDAPAPMLGNFLEFLAMVCATGYMVTCKYLSSRYSPLFITAMQAFAGSVFYFPLLFLPSTTLPSEFSLLPALSVVYLGTFVTMGAYGLYNYGVSKLPASQASAFVNLIPAITVLLGWIILGETFTGWQYVAAGLVFAGVFMSQDRQDQPNQPEQKQAG